MIPIIVDSFGMFLSSIQRGKQFSDSPITFYCFGCPIDDVAIENTCRLRQTTPETFSKVMEFLLPAYQQGRVWFRAEDEKQAQLDFQQFLDVVARRMGLPRIVVETVCTPRWYDAYCNLPAMKELFDRVGWTVDFLFWKGWT
jgi:hypothetical protein